jgi:hypothetical protein
MSTTVAVNPFHSVPSFHQAPTIDQFISLAFASTDRTFVLWDNSLVLSSFSFSGRLGGVSYIVSSNLASQELGKS